MNSPLTSGEAATLGGPSTKNDPTQYYDDLAGQNLAPLWEVLSNLVPAEPKPRAQAHLWSFIEMLPRLLQAGDLISAEQAERRVLMLENPSLGGQARITDTLYAGLQLILPGEIAPAHRHTQSALRFAMYGQGAYTAVEGERVEMSPGDFIITPAWNWHDHGSEADGPVIWLDGLDVPLVSFLNAGFREQYEDKAQAPHRTEGEAMLRYGSGLLRPDDEKTTSSPLFKYSYERTREALSLIAKREAIDPHRTYELRYINPTTGDGALPTIDASMRLIPKGYCTQPYRSTEGAVFVGVEGKISVTIDGKKFRLEPQDVLAVPGWSTHHIEADFESLFFSYSDAPVYKKLGLWREQRM